MEGALPPPTPHLPSAELAEPGALPILPAARPPAVAAGQVAAAAVGGAFGSLLRVLLALAMPPACDAGAGGGGDAAAPLACLLPWPTLTVNLVGSFLLGTILAHAHAHAWRKEVVALLGGGLCGGLTTLSSAALEAVVLGDRGHPGFAALYLFITAAGGLACAGLGYSLPPWRARKGAAVAAG
jgi:CrcB protein